MSPVVRSDALPDWVREVADLLALGYLRARKREAAQLAKERRARKSLNSLAYVAPRWTFATGDSATSAEG